MKYTSYLFTVVLGIGLLCSVCRAEEKPKLTDLKDRVSYSLGYTFGENLKKQGVEINLDVYTAGFRDATAGKERVLSQEEIQAVIYELQRRQAASRQKDLQEQGARNLAAGKAFLEENKKHDGMKVLPSGLQYKVLEEGSGKMPVGQDTVTVNYRGTLIDGTEFDSSLKRGQPATFRANEVIKGWTEALQLMKEGAKWQLFIPPELGYGEHGNAVIGPNSVLVFEVVLISVGTPEKK